MVWKSSHRENYMRRKEGRRGARQLGLHSTCRSLLLSSLPDRPFESRLDAHLGCGIDAIDPRESCRPHPASTMLQSAVLYTLGFPLGIPREKSTKHPISPSLEMYVLVRQYDYQPFCFWQPPAFVQSALHLRGGGAWVWFVNPPYRSRLIRSAPSLLSLQVPLLGR